jgi:integrase
MALFRYPGRKTWWYDFRYCGQAIRESARTRNKEVARRAELARRLSLQEGYHNLQPKRLPRLFSVASQEWLEMKRPTLAPKSLLIEKTNLNHILPAMGKHLVTSIRAVDIADYQKVRLAEKASPKTVNLEVSTIRAILRWCNTWSHVQRDVRMLPTRDDTGYSLTAAEEKMLLDACKTSRSRSLYPAVVLAINTGLRYSDIRLLRWKQVDLDAGFVRVGKSKTVYSTDRVVWLNANALAAMSDWSRQFPAREQQHFVFPSERYGQKREPSTTTAYNIDVNKPIGTFKTAWKSAKKASGVKCRFHDLRHTACTRMLEAGIPLSVVASVMGWSPATTTRMAKRYGHIGQEAQRKAMDSIAN